MQEYFEYLEKYFPEIDGEVSIDSVDKLSANQLADVAQKITSLIPSLQSSPSISQKSIFNHCASLSIGGGRADCWSFDCRKNKLDQLARLAALYSDKIYINNFFSFFNSHNINKETIKSDFYDDLSLIYFIRPLLESGHISIISEIPDYCPCCMSGAIVGDQNNKNRIREVDNAVNKLSKEYFDNSTVYIECDENGIIGLSVEAPQPYFEHGAQFVSVSQLPDFVIMNQRVTRELQKRGKARVTREVQKKLALHSMTAEEIKKQIYYETYVNDILGTTYLTDKSIHIQFLDKLSNSSLTTKRNSIISNYLTSFVPFAEDVPINKLLSLRNRENESFIQFRTSLNKAVLETNSLHENFDEITAREIFADIIHPGIIRLEQKVKEAKNDLAKKTYRSFFGVVGAISFGMYTGLLPTEVIAIAKAIGFGKVSHDFITKLMALGDAKDTIKGEDLYFLWQIKKMSEKETIIKRIKNAK